MARGHKPKVVMKKSHPRYSRLRKTVTTVTGLDEGSSGLIIRMIVSQENSKGLRCLNRREVTPDLVFMRTHMSTTDK
jgi:hypothetical protein